MATTTFKYMHYEGVSVSSGAYVSSARIQFGFDADTIILYNATDSAKVFFSFNGADDHGLVGSSANNFNPRTLHLKSEKDIWLRLDSGSAQTVHVEAMRNS